MVRGNGMLSEFMSPRKFGFLAIFAAALPLLFLTDHLTEASSRIYAAVTGSPHVSREAVIVNEGSSRDAKLLQLTTLYAARFPAESARLKAGTDLAPANFLNGELDREGAKWRVRNVTGATADIYDIS
jgi:hypothetical protein